MIHEDIKSELRTAMIAKDAVKLTVLRGLLAGFTNELVAMRKKPNEIIDDADAQKVIMRQVKQHRDSIEQFRAGGRPDLVESEEQELVILEEFLPAQMSEDEIRKVVETKKAEMGGTIDKTKAGQFTGMVMKELKGRADGTLVKKIIDQMLA